MKKKKEKKKDQRNNPMIFAKYLRGYHNQGLVLQSVRQQDRFCTRIVQ